MPNKRKDKEYVNEYNKAFYEQITIRARKEFLLRKKLKEHCGKKGITVNQFILLAIYEKMKRG